MPHRPPRSKTRFQKILINEKDGKGVALLLAYSAGMAIPLLLAAFMTARFFAFMARFRGAMRYVEIVAGVVLAAAGVLLFLDKLMIVG